jgi:hypothetical protein
MAGVLGHVDVVKRPQEVARRIVDIPNVSVDRVLAWRRGVEFDLTFASPAELAAAGYGPEQARLLVPWSGEPEAWPRGKRRPWKHRNPRRGDIDDRWTTGSLCLYYPHDPRPLRWVWEDGLEAYVIRMQRHLFYEEYYRREHEWPVEDTPHGHPAKGAHPIRSDLLREVVDAWRR